MLDAKTLQAHTLWTQSEFYNLHHFFIGSRLKSTEQKNRMSGDTFITIIDRHTHQRIKRVYIGYFGNTYDNMLLHAADQSDQQWQPPWWKALLSLTRKKSVNKKVAV